MSRKIAYALAILFFSVAALIHFGSEYKDNKPAREVAERNKRVLREVAEMRQEEKENKQSGPPYSGPEGETYKLVGIPPFQNDDIPTADSSEELDKLRDSFCVAEGCNRRPGNTFDYRQGYSFVDSFGSSYSYGYRSSHIHFLKPGTLVKVVSHKYAEWLKVRVLDGPDSEAAVYVKFGTVTFNSR